MKDGKPKSMFSHSRVIKPGVGVEGQLGVCLCPRVGSGRGFGGTCFTLAPNNRVTAGNKTDFLIGLTHL